MTFLMQLGYGEGFTFWEVIRTHLEETRGITIWTGNPDHCVTPSELPALDEAEPSRAALIRAVEDNALFKSDDLAKCLEWALKQPYKETAEVIA